MEELSIDQLKISFNELQPKLKLEAKKQRISELEQLSGDPNFWKDQQKAAKAMQELADLQEEIQTTEAISLELQKSLNQIELKQLDKRIYELTIKTFLSGKYDRSDAILSVHAGQGGTEACDWAQMLYRMYVKYCQKKNWKVGILDQHPGDEAGIKSIILEVKGAYAYGYLKHEKGTHRLVRQSPFNANNLRQTSFTLVEVMPVIEEDTEVIIKDDDIKFESCHASGHGGQNVNKVSTAVRITHLPTKIIVECSSQRYQEQNRKIAMQILKGKIWQLQEMQREKKMQEIKGVHRIAGWGNQIRSYVLHPYKLVRDERIDYSENNAQAVLDGNLDGFIQAGLKNL